ncbi:MAG: hypothetical protein JXR44_07845 [Thiotrichales bacterium]|nr:hypothetical protein [Thiotrichales bacterium]
MNLRNKQKDKNRMGGFFSVNLLSTGVPMGVLAMIYSALSFTFGSAV